MHRGKFVSLYKRPGQRVVMNAAGDIAVRPNTVEVRSVVTFVPVPKWFTSGTVIQLFHCMLLINNRWP